MELFLLGLASGLFLAITPWLWKKWIFFMGDVENKPVIYTNRYGATGHRPADMIDTGPTGYTGAIPQQRAAERGFDEMKMQQWKNYKNQHVAPGRPFSNSPLNMHRDEWVKYKQQFGIPPDEDMRNYFSTGSGYTGQKGPDNDPAGLPVQEDGHYVERSFNTIGKAAYFNNHNPFPLISVTVKYRIPKRIGPTGPSQPDSKIVFEHPSYTFGKKGRSKK